MISKLENTVAYQAAMVTAAPQKEILLVCHSFPMARRTGKIPVVVHVGAPDIQTVLQLSAHGARIGADALLIVPPYYYTDHNEYEITEHYKAVARAGSLPIYIYNNKRYAGIAGWPPER